MKKEFGILMRTGKVGKIEQFYAEYFFNSNKKTNKKPKTKHKKKHIKNPNKPTNQSSTNNPPHPNTTTRNPCRWCEDMPKILLYIEGLNGFSCENHTCNGTEQQYISVSLSGLLMHLITLIICYGNTVVCSKIRDN